MRLPKFESDPIARAVHKALDLARETARRACGDLDQLAVDWEVADAAYRWGMALLEELPERAQASLGDPEPATRPVDSASLSDEPIAVVTGLLEGVAKDDTSGKNGEGQL
jgi:hypothetical protein